MAKELTDKAVLAAIKKLGVEAAISAYATELGVPTGSIGPTIWRLEPVAKPSLKFKGNKSEIVKARKPKAEGGLGLRYERIAARTGLSIAEVQRLAGDTYTGRGRRFDGSSPAKPATSGRRGGRGQTKATSGRRAAGSGGKKTTTPKPRARTRAERQAKAVRSPS